MGTSGWVYPHWRGVFYPPGLASREWLERYASTFPTVEVNYSFYRLPRPQTFADWRDRVPPSFLFAVKASRYITHVRRLADCEEPLARFLESAANLGPRLGPILFQLPPAFPLDIDRLVAFLDLLPTNRRFVFEFRHVSWLNDEVYESLRRRNVALCASASGAAPAPWVATADFAYCRMHFGAGGPAFSEAELSATADLVRKATAAGREAFVYFNNDVGGHAVQDAQRLRELLDRPMDSRLVA